MRGRKSEERWRKEQSYEEWAGRQKRRKEWDEKLKKEQGGRGRWKEEREKKEVKRAMAPTQGDEFIWEHTPHQTTEREEHLPFSPSGDGLTEDYSSYGRLDKR